MKFWEDFFSTDKIIYPSIGAFLGGIIICVGAFLINLSITEVHILIFMFFGFIIGNLIKINKLHEKVESPVNEPSTKKKKT